MSWGKWRNCFLCSLSAALFVHCVHGNDTECSPKGMVCLRRKYWLYHRITHKCSDKLNIWYLWCYIYMQFKDITTFSFKLIWLWMSGFGTVLKAHGAELFCRLWRTACKTALRRSVPSVARRTPCLALDNIKLTLACSLLHSGRYFGCDGCLLQMQ